MKSRSVVLLWVVAVLLLASCTSPQPPSAAEPTTIVVQDALGREVTLHGIPERIVIAGRANFMLNNTVYLFPEAPARVIGLTQAQQQALPFISLLDPDYAEKERFTSDSSAEEIAAAQPDLVLLKRMMQPSLGVALEQLEIPIVYLDFEDPAQYERDLAILGQIFADPERAAAAWEHYRTLLEKLDAELANLPPELRPSVLLVQYDPRGGEVALRVPPVSWIQTQMVELAGGVPVWRDAAEAGGWATVNFEQIAAWNPDAIVVISYFERVDDVMALLRADANWQALSAVQAGRLHGFPKDFHSWDQPDTRWSLGLAWLARSLHPERFAELDLNSMFYDFYQDLYRLDAAVVNTQVVPLLEGDFDPMVP